MTNEAATMPIDSQRVRACYETAKEMLLSERVDGHWVGELSASALSTATAVSALSLVSRERQRPEISDLRNLIDGGVKYLAEHQNADGGWGDTDKSYSNIATTYLCVAAIHLSDNACGLAEQLRRAKQYIENNGAIEGLKARYGVDKTFVVPILTNCALAGLVPWSVVDPLPFELAVVPQKWYRFVGMPVVSYAIPALVAIGQAKYFHSPPWNPLTRAIRSMSISRSLKVLRQMQPASGGYLEAVPLTSFVVMSLASICGPLAPREESGPSYRSSIRQNDCLTGSVRATILDSGVKFLIDSVRPDGSWPIDTNLATWVTTLALNALAGAGEDITQYADLDWLLKCQHNERHPFTGADPGGWGWSDLSGAVPDADDTPGAMMALNHFVDECVVMHPDELQAGILSVQKMLERFITPSSEGTAWLLQLQNRDGGWPTFCRGWGRLPFDRSGVDLTAHVIRALISPGNEHPKLAKFLCSPRIDAAVARGFAFIERHQRPDGSWIPLWFGNQDDPNEENPIYGTAKVLMAYRDTGRTGTPAAQRGFEYLIRSQNADGGWGGGASVRNKGIKWGDQVIESTVEETALAVEALLAAASEPQALARGVNGTITPGANASGSRDIALSRGLAWLCAAVDNGNLFDPAPIGFYFAKLWYYERLYPLVFTVSALGRALQHDPPSA
jgi:squalene-hopene/tetraprenyl-beta-curcumene cyclase